MTSKRGVAAILPLSALVMMLFAISVTDSVDHATIMHSWQTHTQDGPVATKIEVTP